MFNEVEKSVKIEGRTISLETGRIARQANGSVLVTSGDTQVLVAVTAARDQRPGQDFFPLSVEYIEKIYAAGRIPGGYLKREGRLSTNEILTCRLIDRPIRPLFPEGYCCEVQIVAQVLSYCPTHPADVLAMLGASCALHLSDLPFAGPIAGVRVGYKKDKKKFVVNFGDMADDESDLHLFVAGSADAILMVEAGANFIEEDVMLKAIELAHSHIKTLCQMQEDLRAEMGVPKREVVESKGNASLAKAFDRQFGKRMLEVMQVPKKLERREAINSLKAAAKAALVPVDADPSLAADFAKVFENASYYAVRNNILDSNRRIDGRKCDQIRAIDCQVGVLKRTHGSALFTRGETQSIGVVTLGTMDDCQHVETLANSIEDHRFLMHYNMPGYSVGECKRLGPVSRREVGHGHLAERALAPILPSTLKFPYTIRIVSEITESNGSSSMASVCSGCLGMMDAGVPISEPVAGIAMGLIKEGDRFAVLSDILGDEDHLGDMDFKVTGNDKGITALQMDMKISGVTMEILSDALAQARDGRLHILGEMMKTLKRPKDISARAPRVEQMKIKPERIRDLIGPGGRNIKRLVAESGCKVNVDETGVVTLASTTGEAAALAKKMIQALTTDPQIGEVYLGTVKKVADFGAFVEIKPGVEGLVHVSHLAEERVKSVEDILAEGDEVMVKVIELDRTGRIKLSRKDAIGKEPTFEFNWR